MRYLGRVGTALIVGLGYALKYLFTLEWVRQIIELFRGLGEIGRRRRRLDDHRRGRDPRCHPDCGKITPDVYRRADPMIYSQRYLQEQGLAVTWDNPDIQLYRNGLPVPSSSLDADTDYKVEATIWNNSVDAPAVGLGVDFFYHDFGIGTAPIPIGVDTVTLPVKGAPGHPVKANAVWHTPVTPGHYCIKVQLDWTDDANPKNNLGQENTNVGKASSPATFVFPVRNEASVRRVLRLVADAYTIPALMDCRERPKKKDSDRRHRALASVPAFIPATERNADWTHARLRHGPETHPVPPGWTVEFEPETLDLAPDQEQQVTATVTPPPDFTGRQAINVNALQGTDLAGGVTLLVDSDQEG